MYVCVILSLSLCSGGERQANCITRLVSSLLNEQQQSPAPAPACLPRLPAALKTCSSPRLDRINIPYAYASHCPSDQTSFQPLPHPSEWEWVGLLPYLPASPLTYLYRSLSHTRLDSPAPASWSDLMLCTLHCLPASGTLTFPGVGTFFFQTRLGIIICPCMYARSLPYLPLLIPLAQLPSLLSLTANMHRPWQDGRIPHRKIRKF